jgi:hypothetical protein
LALDFKADYQWLDVKVGGGLEEGRLFTDKIERLKVTCEPRLELSSRHMRSLWI